MSAVLHNLGFVAGLAIYYIVMFGSLCVIPLGIPGEFGILFATAVFTLAAGSSLMPWWVSLVLLALCLLAEGVEAVMGYWGARRAKGSFLSALGAVAGGFAGAVAGASFGLIVGSLAGAFLGTFAGAFAVEYLRTRSHEGSSRVATGALLGRVFGSVIKTAIAFVMIALVTVVLLASGIREFRQRREPPGESVGWRRNAAYGCVWHRPVSE
jgi:uncharacterized protein YqgC (DUF456 family)